MGIEIIRYTGLLPWLLFTDPAGAIDTIISIGLEGLEFVFDVGIDVFEGAGEAALIFMETVTTRTGTALRELSSKVVNRNNAIKAGLAITGTFMAIEASKSIGTAIGQDIGKGVVKEVKL